MADGVFSASTCVHVSTTYHACTLGSRSRLLPQLRSRCDEINCYWSKYKNQTPWPLVRKRTTPTERPPHVGEVTANFCGYRGIAWSLQRIPTVVNLSFLDRSRYNFYLSKYLIYLHEAELTPVPAL
jgi:hypothetical protein